VWVVCFADRLRGGEINDEFESARLLDVLPIAFAVVRLTTSSNLLGCSTGMSAAVAPCNTLSTEFYGAAPAAKPLGPRNRLFTVHTGFFLFINLRVTDGRVGKNSAANDCA